MVKNRVRMKSGCPKCGNESQAIKISKPKYDKSELLKKLHNVHGYNKFDYSLIEDEKFVYNGVKTKIPVKCNACGTIFYPIVCIPQ